MNNTDKAIYNIIGENTYLAWETQCEFAASRLLVIFADSPEEAKEIAEKQLYKTGHRITIAVEKAKKTDDCRAWEV